MVFNGIYRMIKKTENDIYFTFLSLLQRDWIDNKEDIPNVCQYNESFSCYLSELMNKVDIQTRYLSREYKKKTDNEMINSSKPYLLVLPSFKW